MTKHPQGLYPLFFTEMWERLAFYLMLGILVLYATDTERGGLGLSVTMAGEIYGTYLAFVYFTPFLGGMIADRYLGYRRSVFIGGLCMAIGFFLLGIRSLPTFYAGLVALCLGNGLFKPNISAMVGNLYVPGDPNRDSGFNIFYMGINIGATLSALLAAPLRNLFSFNYAFVGAGVGLLIGVLILSCNWRKLASADRRSEPSPGDVTFGRICLAILLPGAIFGILGYFVGKRVDFIDSTIGPITFGFIVGMLPILGYFVFLVRRASPEEKPGLGALLPVFVAGGTFFMILHLSGGLMTFFTENVTNRRAEWIPETLAFYRQKAMPSYFKNADPELPRPDERMLVVVHDDGAAMFGAKRVSMSMMEKVTAANKDVIALDKAKDSQSIQTSWNDLVCKVFPDENVKVTREKDSHGVSTTTVRIDPDTATPLREVLFARRLELEQNPTIIPVLLLTQQDFDAVYANASDARVPPGEFIGLMNAELIAGFLNPIFVVLLTPLVVTFFAWRLRRGKGITTARKIFYGMLITTISLVFMVIATYLSGDGAQKVSVAWLVIYYLIITAGELCLSPMGLSLVTKLSPPRLVGLMMGGWFLSTAIGNKLAGFISGLEPTWRMFTTLGVATLLVAAFIFVLLPKLDRAIKQYGA
ncbi:MAG: peptide MFS transporter [Pirellulales bacterium]|nr:peptide MFS transporter [Pirellulales bacterium]